MLKNIKSSYFYQIIFSFIIEKRKLELFKYNKDIQNKLDITLYDYRQFSQKYIKYETKNKGKEYNFKDDTLIYEGEYLNGERNGKGKEYDYGRLIYEGEYLNGKRNGKGKEYWFRGELRFEGEYLNGKRNGKGKEYYTNGIIEYEGEYLNGKKHKKVKEYYSDGTLKFEGEYLNGKILNAKIYDKNDNKEYEIKNGKGYIKEYDYGELQFEGEYLNGERNGKGKEYANNRLIYEGEYLNGERNGKGKEYDEDYHRLKFEGEFLKGKRWNGIGYGHSDDYELVDGKGFVKESFSWGRLKFEGEFLNGERNGKGKEIHPHLFGIEWFENEYLNGEKNGKGKHYNNGHIVFDGEYLNGKKHGKGTQYHLFGYDLEFEGEFFQGNKKKGKEYIKGILVFEGLYLLDKKWEGKGYDKDGNVIYELKNGNGFIKEFDYELNLQYEGEYKDGKRNGNGKEYFHGELEFEGEFLNGEKWNGIYRKKETINGKITIELECQFREGKKNGKGKEYNKEDGTLLFEGEFLNGEKWNGKGKKYDKNGKLIEYEYINGKRKE